MKIDICDEVLVQLRRIVRAMDVYSRKLNREHALTAPQLVLLREIARHDQITIGLLAKEASLSNATVTGIVDRLEHRGLVVRLRNGKDRRQVLLSCTDAGNKLLEGAPALFQEQFVMALSGLPQWEQAQMLASLSHLSTMMSSKGVPSGTITSRPVTSEINAPDGFLASCQMLLDKEQPSSSMYAEQKTCVDVQTIRSEAELIAPLTVDYLADFLHKHLQPYEDTMGDIRRGLQYALSSSPGQGGYVLLAKSGDRLSGVLVMLDTGMSGYVPEHLLLFVAVDGDMRNQGIGAQLIRTAQTQSEGDIKLHVEYHNPARYLYKRMGFISKYAEMRWNNEPCTY